MSVNLAPRPLTSVEARIDAAALHLLARLPQTRHAGALVEFLVFGLKQGWACLFGGLLSGLMMATRLYWPEAAPLGSVPRPRGSRLATLAPHHEGYSRLRSRI